MAGPSIVVRVLGDLASLGKSFSDAADKGQSAGAKLHGAFSGVLSQLNATGVLGPFGNALQGVDDALGRVIGHAKNMGPALMGIGGAVAGLGLGLQQLGSADQRSQQQLQAAIGATGHSYDQYADKVEAAIKHQEHFGDTAAQTQDALRILTQATGDPTKALALLGEATDLAAAKHEDLDTAAGQLGKTYNGAGRLAKEYGLATKDASGHVIDHTVVVAELAKKLSGQGAAAADTFSGKVGAMKAKVEDSVAEFGKKFGPAITAAGAAMTGLGAVIQVTGAATKFFKDQTILSAAASKIAAAAQWLWNAALDANPIMLVVIGLALLVGAIIYAYQHFAWFRDLIHEIWNWIKTYWPLLLDIIFGPIGLAIGLIIQHWQAFLAFFEGIPGEIARIASDMWHWINEAFDRAVGFVKNTWNSFWGWLTGLPGAIGRALGGMWDSIYGAFKGVINRVIDLWNDLHFTLPKIDFGPIHLGGETIGVPHIPHLAQGGLITQTGLVYAHAGEAISPIPKGVGGGPAVHVENAHFHTDVDLDAFMRRVAWVSSTRRM